MEIEDSGIARKRRTEIQLQERGVPTLDWLPHIAQSEVKLRTPREVAERAFGLCAAAVHAEMLLLGNTEPIAMQFLEARQLTYVLSPEERKFLENPAPTEEEKGTFSWRYEGVLVLLWALQQIDTLGFPEDVCDVRFITTLLRDVDHEKFLSEATLRSEDAILDELDLSYRCHWAVRNAMLTSTPVPEALEPGVVYERHFALNWLTDAENTAWDDTDTST